MVEYFTGEGVSVGLAYSLLVCRDHKLGHKHGPHPHRLEAHPSLGPFMCSGRPMQPLYNLNKENK